MKQKTLERIEALERRIADLERNQEFRWWYPPVPVPMWVPPMSPTCAPQQLPVIVTSDRTQ